MVTFRIGGVAALFVCAFASLSGVAAAAPASSFTGNFATDSDQREFFFTVSSPGTVTLRSWSYAGGTNGAGTVVPPGGFDPTLSLYDSSGALIALNQDAGCGTVAADPVTSSCWDALISAALPAGSYRLVLTQSINVPAGPFLTDSFLFNPANLFQNSNKVNNVAAPPFGGQANFTQPPGAASPGFWDFFPSQRTSFYALDIIGAQSAAAPAITTSSTLPFGITGTSYAPLTFAVQSGAGVSYVWTPPASGLPPGLTLNSAGILSGTPSSSGTYTFVAAATDGIQSVQKTETLIVYDPLTVTTSSLPPGTPGTSYGPVQLTSSGGSGVETWSSGGLPAGLSLSASGVLSGVVPASLTAFTVTATDTVTGQTASKPLSFAITLPPLLISGGGALPEVAVGASVSSSFQASGGTPPYSFAASGLPGGLSLNSGGALTGAATSPGNFSFSVTVTDSGGQSATASSTLSVLGFTSGALPAGTQGTNYSFGFAAAGGTGQYTFSGSGVPQGLSLSSSGALTGKPANAGSQSFTVSVSDGVATASLSLTLSVANSAPITLTVPGGKLADGRVNTAYSANLAATGGTGPYSWALTSGSLPDGLSLATNGAITGSPTLPGTSSFTAQVTDGAGTSAPGSFSILIAPATLTLTSGNSLPNGIVGSDYPLQIFSASGGVQPYVFTLAGSLPPGLTFSSPQISGIPTQTGNFPITATVTDAVGKTASVSLSIQVNPAQADLILSQTFLTFSTMTGATSLPTGNNVTVRSSVVQQLLSYSYTISPAVSWLSVTGGQSTPGSLDISLNSSALGLPANGSPYQTTVMVTCTAPSPCAGHTQTISVMLAVSAPPPQLTLTSTLLSFLAGNPGASVTSPLGIQNSGGGTLAISSVTAADSWVSVSGAPANVASGPPASATVSVNPAGLPSGYNRSSVTVVSSAGTRTVPVTLYITPATIMRPSPEGMQFSMSAGGALSPATGSFQVSVTGAQPVAWNAAVLPGAPWLHLATGSGTSTQGAAGAVSYTIDTAAVAQLPPGNAYASIQLTSSDVTNSPQNYHVTLRVGPAAALPFPNPVPAGLVFQSSAPASQNVTVFASSAASLPYQASASTSNGGSWLSVSPSTGSSSATAPGASNVSVNSAGLAPGVYFGLVNYAFSAAAVRSVNVTLLVNGTSAPAVVSELGPALTARAELACSSKQLVAIHTGLVSNFAQPATLAVPLQVLVLDNCGHPVNDAQVNVTFSNGDAPLQLSALDNTSGIYSGTWIPLAVSPQVTISATATAPPLTSAVARINGEVSAFAGPVLTRNGVLSVYNPLIGGAIAPGAILQLYGANLAPGATAASDVPLSSSLAGTSVSIGGIDAPLYYVSPTQINAQAPFELKAGNQYQVVVNSGGALTPGANFTAIAEAPGIAADQANRIIAQHLDGTLVTAASPAKPDTYVVFYLAGLGATDVPVADGAASPTTPLAHPVTRPVLTLDGAEQPYQFVGMTPGIVGLYQINFLVPSSTRDGDLKVTVSQSGVVSNQVILPVRR